MKYIVTQSVILGLFAIMSCSGNRKSAFQNLSDKKIQYHSLKLDTLFLYPLSSSGSGFFRVSKNRIYYFDLDFLTISEFDTSGKFLNRYLGVGDGDDEIADFRNANFIGDSLLFFFGRTHNISLYSPSFKKKSAMQRINWKKQHLIDNSRESGRYSFNYYNCMYNTKWLPVDSDRKLLIPVWVSPNTDREFNAYNGYQKYFEEAKTIGVVNLQTMEMERVFGNKSNAFSKYGPIPNYDFLSLDVNEDDTIYVSQSIDSTIQVFSPDYKLIRTFGLQGLNMDMNYPEASTPAESENIWIEAYTDYGYYYHVYCDKESDLIFRGYTKGKNNIGGLQIYEGNTLVGDVNVPKRFNVIGKIGDFFYVDGITDEKNSRIAVYRFKLS